MAFRRGVVVRRPVAAAAVISSVARERERQRHRTPEKRVVVITGTSNSQFTCTCCQDPFQRTRNHTEFRSDGSREGAICRVSLKTNIFRVAADYEAAYRLAFVEPYRSETRLSLEVISGEHHIILAHRS